MGRHRDDVDDRATRKRGYSDEDDYDRKRRRKREKQKDKEAKELAKLRETPAEKRARRLAKKEQKERRKREKLGLPESYASFTNEDNPFNDANLTEKFTWHKKIEAAEEKGVKRDDLERSEKRRRKENMAELEKVKKRKEEREAEFLARQEEKDLELKERANEQFAHWIDKEEDFHLEQAKKRSEIRITEGRAKPIDLLAQYIHTASDDVDADMREPALVVEQCDLDDLEDLQEDIKVYMTLEGDTNGTYWTDLMVVTNCCLEEERRRSVLKDPNAPAAQRRALESGINPAVKESIYNLLQGKTSTQLLTMREDIQTQIQGGQVLDVSYWETILGELKFFIAKAHLRERHEALLEHKLDILRQEQMAAADEEAQARMLEAAAADDNDLMSAPLDGGDEEQDAAITGAMWRPPLETVAEEMEEVEAGALSPRPIQDGDEDDEAVEGEELVDPAKDLLELQQHRQRVREQQAKAKPAAEAAGAAGGVAAAAAAAGSSGDGGASALVEAEKSKGMREGEEAFGQEMTLDAESYSWKDKYRPRKPRFFNRVNTGYDWNKYNKTHYDSDNPPPKVVQGYKFNIFFPDLIDKTRAPTYTLTPIPGEPGFCILRISAGPPYEDIAFKIVNRQWEYSHKRAFKCQFARGIFQLHFQFKRERYRR